MAGCPELINATIAGSLDTWGSVDRSALKSFTITSYLRPDTGAALLPWVYTMIAIIVHLPVVVVRVTRWDIVQTWCIVSTLFVVIVYVQAYISTNFAASQILVWTPLILIIDAGSMLQIFFLALETRPMRIQGRVFLFDPTDAEGRVAGRTNRLRHLRRWFGRRKIGRCFYPPPEEPCSDRSVQQDLLLTEIAPTSEIEAGTNNNENAPVGNEAQIDNNQGAPPGASANDADNHQASSGTNSNETAIVGNEARNDNNRGAPPGASAKDADNHQASSVAEQVENWQDPALYTAVASALLFIVVIVLQILGLVAAVRARKAGKSPLVSWCSPTFQPFGVAIVDGDCHVYQINQSLSRGIGCIQIPGIWQRQWLTATIIGTAMSLAFEIVDLFILYKVDSTDKWRTVKMKRPWTTMICGVVMLAITLFYGLQYASMLPPGITERVTVAVDVNGTKAFNAHLTSSGLRGAIIGWNDGLFESWKATYTGSTAN